MDVRVEPHRRLSAEELMLLNCGVGEDSWESLGLQGDPTSHSERKSNPNIHWKDWCWSWSSNTLATWCKELTHWKRKDPDAGTDWRQEEKGMTEDGMVRWHHWLKGWFWAGSGRWWRTRKPVVLQSIGSQRVGHDLVTEQQQQTSGCAGGNSWCDPGACCYCVISGCNTFMVGTASISLVSTSSMLVKLSVFSQREA